MLDARRFTASLPSIAYIIRNGGRVILVTHQGRPQGKVVDELRLNRVRLAISGLLKMPVQLIEGEIGNDGRYHLITDEARRLMKTIRSGVVMLDNTRFDSREQSGDYAERMSLARDLASLADYFVLDGFLWHTVMKHR